MALHTEAEWQKMAADMPLSRVGQPTDIAEGVNFWPAMSPLS
jgi:hypothetical protein